MAKNSLLGVQKMPFFDIWLQIMKIQIFLVKKMSFVLYFKQNWAKLNFFENQSPKKHVLLILLGTVLHRNLRLCLQNEVLNVNNWNQVQNGDLSGSAPPKSCLKWRVVKNSKKFKKRPKMPKIPFLWDHIIKIIGNYLWNKFRNFFGIFWPILVNFHFFTEIPWFFEKKFEKFKKAPFWPLGPTLMGSPCGFSSKPTDKTKKKGWSKNCTINLEISSDSVS